MLEKSATDFGMQYAACKRGSKLTIDISLPAGESILFVNLDAAAASLIWILDLFTDKI